MSTPLDHEIIEATCPNCSGKIKQPWRWYKAQTQVCPACGVTLNLDQVRRVLIDVERAREDLLRAFRKIGK